MSHAVTNIVYDGLKTLGGGSNEVEGPMYAADARRSAGWIGWVVFLGYLVICGLLAGLQ